MKRLEQAGLFLYGLLMLALFLGVPYVCVTGFIRSIRYDKVEAIRQAKWEADCVAMNGQVIYIHNTQPICTKKGSDILGQYR